MIKPGDIFRTYVSPWWLITPVTGNVIVVWNDGENIHYRRESQPIKVLQTPIARFLEAVLK